MITIWNILEEIAIKDLQTDTSRKLALKISTVQMQSFCFKKQKQTPNSIYNPTGLTHTLFFMFGY